MKSITYFLWALAIGIVALVVYSWFNRPQQITETPLPPTIENVIPQGYPLPLPDHNKD